MRPLLNRLLYFPLPDVLQTPSEVGLTYEDVEIATADGERLHGWWVPAPSGPAAGHVLLCHGNAGNVGDRVIHLRLLADAGLDVLAFDYRGYGRSSGRPSEEGTYADARAAREALCDRPGVDPSRLVYLGESLGGAIAARLAVESAPRALVLMSAFTSVRAVARVHYPLIPTTAVPDAYPTVRHVRETEAPVLVVHGDLDDIVPVSHAHELAESARHGRLLVLPGLGHNDLVPFAASTLTDAVGSFARDPDAAGGSMQGARRTRHPGRSA